MGLDSIENDRDVVLLHKKRRPTNDFRSCLDMEILVDKLPSMNYILTAEQNSFSEFFSFENRPFSHLTLTKEIGFHRLIVSIDQ